MPTYQNNIKMNKTTKLTTTRLVIRTLTLKDAPIIRKLAGDVDVAKTTSTIPHPYKKGMAEKFIKSTLEKQKEGKSIELAITLKETGEFLGMVGLKIDKNNDRAEIGYWIGKPFWNKGYCSEASLAIVEFGFKKLKLNKIVGRFMPHNIASGKIIKEKLGMEHEGLLKQHVKRFGKYYDLETCGILRKDWEKKSKNSYLDYK